MRISKRSVVLLASLGLLLFFGVSCATYKTVLTGESANLTAPAGKEGIPIMGYTTPDGVYHRFEGTARVDGDTLEFHAHAVEARGLELEKAEKRFRLARADVFSLNTVGGTNYVGTVLLVALITGTVLVIAAAGSMSSEESML